MSTPTPECPAVDGAPARAPALGTAQAAALEKLIGAWRRVYRVWKPLEAKVEAARKKVVKLLVDAGVESFVSKHGKVSLQRKTTTDWEQLARDLIAPKVIDGMLDRYKSQSEPYTRAPSTWGGDS